MQCPRCKERTEVLETIQRGSDTRRRRRCLAPACQYRFQTIESTLALCPRIVDNAALVDTVRRIAKGRRGFDAEAVAAAIAVDRRKKIIEREQRQRERYDDEHAAPSRLNRDGLNRELGRYR